MHRPKLSGAWWGAPRDFTQVERDRSVSFQELFFDVVYVTAIAGITHHLGSHFGWESFLEYAALFGLIFWGWLNGSVYHDLHGHDGLRTRLMTLWQMMIVAALAVVLDRGTEEGYANITYVFLFLQLFITYLWWSVGFYDPTHPRYSWPYTVLYLVAAGLMALTLVTPASWLSVLFPLILICNYLPPFLTDRLLRRDGRGLDLTSSMFERLGLFTIIVLGELVVGVTSGISAAAEGERSIDWVTFCLAIALVFMLWWILFTLVARREPKPGLSVASLLELLYIPALLSLGVIAAAFFTLFDGQHHAVPLQAVFSGAIAAFLLVINLMLSLLTFPDFIHDLKGKMRLSLGLTTGIFLILAVLDLHLPVPYYLALVLLLLGAMILYLNVNYFRRLGRVDEDGEGIDLA